MRTSNHRSVIISASPVRRVVGFLSRVVLQSDGMKQILRLNSPECRRNPAYQTYLSILTFNHGASLAEPAACSDRGDPAVHVARISNIKIPCPVASSATSGGCIDACRDGEIEQHVRQVRSREAVK